MDRNTKQHGIPCHGSTRASADTRKGVVTMAMMTRKHFEAIAQVLLEVNAQTDIGTPARSAVIACAIGLADICQDDNPNFDRVKFLQAVGL